MKQYPGEIKQVNGWYAISAQQVAVRAIYDPAVEDSRSDYRGMAGWIQKAIEQRSLTPNRSTSSKDALIVDFAGGDAYATEVRGALERARIETTQHPKLQELLRKPFWTRDDRQIYEASLAQIVSGELAKSPLLAKYRTAETARAKTGEPENLNFVTPDKTFNCRGMAVTHAFVMQSLEDGLLPVATGRSGIWKERGDYYLATGTLSSAQNAGGHLFVLTPVGNVIESTEGEKRAAFPYREVLAANHGFEQAIAGYPLITRSLHVTPEGEFGTIEGEGVTVYNQDMRGPSAGKTLYPTRERSVYAGDWDNVSTIASGGSRFWPVKEGEMSPAVQNENMNLAGRADGACDLVSLDAACYESLRKLSYRPENNNSLDPGLHGVNRDAKGDRQKKSETEILKSETTRSF